MTFAEIVYIVIMVYRGNIQEVSYSINGYDFGEGLSCNAMAKAPGTYTITAHTLSRDGYSFTNSISVTFRFPNADEVKAKYLSQMNALWFKSIAAANETDTYEFGLAMIINTTENGDPVYDKKEFQSEAFSYSDTEWGVEFTGLIAAGDHIFGGMWTIGLFHTHPSWHYANKSRVVGKSSEDHDPGNGIPAWVMDYHPDGKIGTHRSISPIGADLARNSPGKLEQYGGNGRIN